LSMPFGASFDAMARMIDPALALFFNFGKWIAYCRRSQENAA